MKNCFFIHLKINSTERLPEEIQLQDPVTEVKENEKCQVAGWGPEKNDGSDPVDQLNVVDVTVISQKACKDQIPELGANAICTGGKQTLDNGGFCKVCFIDTFVSYSKRRYNIMHNLFNK